MSQSQREFQAMENAFVARRTCACPAFESRRNVRRIAHSGFGNRRCAWGTGGAPGEQEVRTGNRRCAPETGWKGSRDWAPAPPRCPPGAKRLTSWQLVATEGRHRRVDTVPAAVRGASPPERPPDALSHGESEAWMTSVSRLPLRRFGAPSLLRLCNLLTSVSLRSSPSPLEAQTTEHRNERNQPAA